MESSDSHSISIDDMPVELLVLIFSNVQPLQLVTTSLCCKSWHSIIFGSPSTSLLVWKGVWYNTFGAPIFQNNARPYFTASIKASMTLEKRSKTDDYDATGSHVIFTENNAHASDRFCWAARHGHSSYVKRFLAYLAESPNLVSILNDWRLQVESSLQACPLFLAAQEKHFEIVRMLIEHGADVNNQAPDDDAATPLLAAIQSGGLEIVKLLLENNADPNKSAPEISPLYFAAQNGSYQVCEMLINHGAEINRRHPSYGVTPLFIATQNCHTKIIKLLLDNHADPDLARDSDGASPLSIARHSKDIEVQQIFRPIELLRANSKSQS